MDEEGHTVENPVKSELSGTRRDIRVAAGERVAEYLGHPPVSRSTTQLGGPTTLSALSSLGTLRVNAPRSATPS